MRLLSRRRLSREETMIGAGVLMAVLVDRLGGTVEINYDQAAAVLVEGITLETEHRPDGLVLTARRARG